LIEPSLSIFKEFVLSGDYSSFKRKVWLQSQCTRILKRRVSHCISWRYWGAVGLVI